MQRKLMLCAAFVLATLVIILADHGGPPRLPARPRLTSQGRGRAPGLMRLAAATSRCGWPKRQQGDRQAKCGEAWCPCSELCR